jgi:hypothetical protein
LAQGCDEIDMYALNAMEGRWGSGRAAPAPEPDMDDDDDDNDDDNDRLLMMIDDDE